MRRAWKNTVIVVSVIMAASITGALAVQSYVSQHSMPMKATVQAAYSLFVNGTQYGNGTTLDWGNVSAGNSYNATLDVYNSGGSVFTVQLDNATLTTGWTLTYDRQNTSVPIGGWLNGTLTLVVPSNATAAIYTWQCYVDLLE
jgi:hypothetical protein